jgi:hypothetical protein
LLFRYAHGYIIPEILFNLDSLVNADSQVSEIMTKEINTKFAKCCNQLNYYYSRQSTKPILGNCEKNVGKMHFKAGISNDGRITEITIEQEDIECNVMKERLLNCIKAIRLDKNIITKSMEIYGNYNFRARDNAEEVSIYWAIIIILSAAILFAMGWYLH